MRFKDFLNEEGQLPSVPSSKKISYTAALKWAKENSPYVMNNIKAGKFNFVRGVMGASGDYQIGDSRTFKRVSKNTKNYYTKFISTSKSWKSFPSRESCFIGASTKRIAEGYGDVFAVIPADNAHMGICPAHDLWKSFPALEDAFNISSLTPFMDILIEIMKAELGKVIDDKNIDELREAMRSWSMKDMHDFSVGLFKHKVKVPRYVLESVQHFVHFMAEKHARNVEHALELCFDPEVNSFRQMPAKRCLFGKSESVEMWVEGEAMFIKLDKLDKFVEDYYAS